MYDTELGIDNSLNITYISRPFPQKTSFTIIGLLYIDGYLSRQIHTYQGARCHCFLSIRVKVCYPLPLILNVKLLP